MDALYNAIIANKQKAIVGFVITFLTAYFAQHGIDISTITVKEFIELLLYGALGYVGVYIKRNK